MVGWTIYESPLGPLTICAGRRGITGLFFPRRSPALAEELRRALPQAEAQLQQYFAGERLAFELELDLPGTLLQRRVWAALQEIPYGETLTYAGLADKVGAQAFPAAAAEHERARIAGWAVGRTPTPILVPCHRVVGADGSLTGYLGGLQRKQALLDLERRGVAGLAPEPAWTFRQMAML